MVGIASSRFGRKSVMASCSLVSAFVPVARVLFPTGRLEPFTGIGITGCASGPIQVAILTPGVLEVQLKEITQTELKGGDSEVLYHDDNDNG